MRRAIVTVHRARRAARSPVAREQRKPPSSRHGLSEREVAATLYPHTGRVDIAPIDLQSAGPPPRQSEQD
jgi:hypothetical protein